MKTPSDVYNMMQVALAHIEDLKTVRNITEMAPAPQRVFDKQPKDVYERLGDIFGLLGQIADLARTEPIEAHPAPEEILPRHIFQSVVRLNDYLVQLKRRLGARNHFPAPKSTLRISPSHVYVQAEKIFEELELLQRSLMAG